MEQLSPQDLIEKSGCLLEASHSKVQWQSVPRIICIGKKEWSRDLPSCFGGWAMLFQSHLFDLPKDLVLHSQGSEHSRGATVIFESVILNLKGEELHSWSSYSNTTFLLDNDLLYYIKEKQVDPRKFGTNEFFFCKIKLKTMAIKERKIDFSALLGDPSYIIFGRKLIVKNGEGYLEVTYSPGREYKRKNKRIPLSKL